MGSKLDSIEDKIQKRVFLTSVKLTKLHFASKWQLIQYYMKNKHYDMDHEINTVSIDIKKKCKGIM